MIKFDKFYFESFEFDFSSLEASFFYSFDQKEFFEEKIFFSSTYFDTSKNLDKDAINNLLFNIHIALGISYYKLFPTKYLVVKSGLLDENQKDFWIKFYKNGLGEFLIKNDIDPNGLFQFESSNSEKYNSKVSLGDSYNKSLLMWGGGKDSIVSSILLEEGKKDFTPFVFGKLDNIKEETLGVLGKKPLLVKRELSTNLFKLNEAGYYNGHVPITGIIAFISLLSAYLYGYKDIVLSNERSANESNTVWKGLNINHQYSKSEEFENDFNSYVKKYISNDIKYYSLLRNKYEYEIAKIFSFKAEKYFTSFSSCNNNFKINRSSSHTRKWCCNCEKCSFVYLILSPFLEEEKMLAIFGENLFDKKDLLETFEELIGFSKHKPFECVGTYEESFLSIYKTLQKYKNKTNSGEIKKIPYILQYLEEKVEKEAGSIYLEELEKKLTNS